MDTKVIELTADEHGISHKVVWDNEGYGDDFEFFLWPLDGGGWELRDDMDSLVDEHVKTLDAAVTAVDAEMDARAEAQWYDKMNGL